METFGSSSEVFEINTKGVCLLCLKSNYSTSETVRGNCVVSSSSFKMLLRYLKINTYNMCNFSSSFLQSMDALEDANLAVSLCSHCTNTVEAISKLYQNMERIRLQLDSYLQGLHDAMQRGKSSGARVDEYRRRMRSRNIPEMFIASVADNLRNETMKKCSQRVEAMVPRVSLLQREPSSLSTFFGIPSQQRKVPGPKSKTKIKKESSKLKSLLTQQSDNSTRNNSFLLGSLLGNANSTEDSNNSASALNDAITNGLEVSEEFIVKVEPMIVDHDTSNFHNENEDEIGPDFDVKTSSIANFDGQLIGHFLGGNDDDDDVDKTLTSNESNHNKSSSTKGGDFFCNICTKSFSSAFSLGGHMHIHKNRPKVGHKKIVKVEEGVAKKIKKRALKKKKGKGKYKCSVCKKILTTHDTYLAHLKRYHSGVKGAEGGKTFDCEVCGKQFFQQTIHRTHMVSLHSMHVFSKYLPPGTTEEQLDTAIQGAVAQHREIQDPNKKKSKFYGCQYCTQVQPHPSHLRLHILRHHFDKVVVMLQSLFDGSVDFETESGEVNGDVQNAVSNDMQQLLEEGDGEEEVMGEEEDEINPQPILLSEVYSLADDVGDNESTDSILQNGIQNEELSNVSDDPLLDI